MKLLFVIMTIVVISITTSAVYAISPITFSFDKTVYGDGEKVMINGKVIPTAPAQKLTFIIQLKSTHANFVTEAKEWLVNSDNTFSGHLMTCGGNLNYPGNYTVSFTYGDHFRTTHYFECDYIWRG